MMTKAVMMTKGQMLTSIILMGWGETAGWILKDYVSATLAEWRFKLKIKMSSLSHRHAVFKKESLLIFYHVSRWISHTDMDSGLQS